MIYSPDHKFLLIKNLKVGGTSVEVELSKVLPDNAIVTKIFPENIDHKPRNYDGFYNHITFEEIKSKIDITNISSYVIVRNPYDMVISYFFHIMHDLGIHITDSNIDKFLDNHIFGGYFLKSTKNLYMIKDKVMVKDFIKYEYGIENQLNKILSSHNISNINLNTFEKTYRPNVYRNKQILNKKHIGIINKEWEWEFNNLGYEAF